MNAVHIHIFLIEGIEFEFGRRSGDCRSVCQQSDRDFFFCRRTGTCTVASIVCLNRRLATCKSCHADKGGDKKEEAVWGEMPAGAKTTYIGIHGGTVPVSLLTAGDGSPMIALVGLTGSDFLNFLRTNDRLQEEPLFADNTGIYAPGAHPSDISDSPVQPTAADVPTPHLTGNATQPITGNATQPMAPSEQAVQQTADNQPTELPATDPAIPSESNATLLLAGSSSGDIPVNYATGRNFERLSLVPANWAPFGLTEKALSLEGEVKVLAPPMMMPKRHTIKKKLH